ncbi:MAG: hypothetical protein BWY85_00277 [Firmicutes bacterium ADurb.Bin506]|nr:MAG: hypothetical protein BWY85_00277 [Firmicutes bacterium ADurb.Bin506]
MKKQLVEISRGQTFRAAGIEWLVLGAEDSKGNWRPELTRVVSTGIVEKRAFDEGGDNDFRSSSLKTYLNGEFLERLEDDFPPDAIVAQAIDLTADDGLKDYGRDEVKVGLLTMEEYRKNRDILPPIGEWWWTATPYSTPSGAGNSFVRLVYTDGSASSSYAYGGHYGVRPALYLNSEISVSVDGTDDEETTPEQQEMALYEKAVEKFGERAQVLMAVEEMSELTKALLKYTRNTDFGHGNRNDILKSIAEERADVSIMLNQLEVIFGDNTDAATAAGHKPIRPKVEAVEIATENGLIRAEIRDTESTRLRLLIEIRQEETK